MELQVTNIDRLSGNDLTSQFTMRYRLESDPDVDGSYTTVATTQTTVGITYPWLDVESLSPDIYVVHTYYTPDGSATGTKITIDLTDTIPPLP